MSINKDKKLQELEELKKSLSDTLTPEELDDIFKSDDMDEDDEEKKEGEDEEEEKEDKKEEKTEKSEKEDLQPRTEEEIKKSIANDISELKRIQGIVEPTAIEKSLKDTNDKLEKSLRDIREENEDLKKSLSNNSDLLKSLGEKIEAIGQNSQGTKHRMNFTHIEKSTEEDLSQEGKTVVSVSDKENFTKSLGDCWEGAEGAEKDLLEKAMINYNGSGVLTSDSATLVKIQRAMAKQDIVITK